MHKQFALWYNYLINYIYMYLYFVFKQKTPLPSDDHPHQPICIFYDQSLVLIHERKPIGQWSGFSKWRQKIIQWISGIQKWRICKLSFWIILSKYQLQHFNKHSNWHDWINFLFLNMLKTHTDDIWQKRSTLISTNMEQHFSFSDIIWYPAEFKYLIIV